MEDKKMVKDPIVHNVIMENREKISVSGVIDVESFNEETIVLQTQMGLLTIQGFNLHINKLSVDTGELSIEGEVASLIYQDDDGYANKGGFFTKLFK